MEHAKFTFTVLISVVNLIEFRPIFALAFVSHFFYWRKDTDGTWTVFQFEILLHQKNFERVCLPFKKNLERLGIEVSIRLVDTAQYINRINDFDFDMIVGGFGQSLSPGNEQMEFWHSSSADAHGSRNYAGIKNPAVDAIVERLVVARDRETLVTACHALDRVLLWNYYMIPQWHLPAYRVAYWDKFEHVRPLPKYGLSFMSWWINAEKEKNLDSGSRR